MAKYKKLDVRAKSIDNYQRSHHNVSKKNEYKIKIKQIHTYIEIINSFETIWNVLC